MRVALMQPYLFPYLGYFQLIAAVDRFVVFDNVQYLRRGWMHRNRVLAPDGGWSWLGLPVVRAPRDTPIRDVAVNREVDVAARFDAALSPYRGVAAHAALVDELVTRVVAAEDELLVDVVERGLAAVCGLVDLPFTHVRASELGLARDADEPVSAWAIGACRALGADTYVNMAGGRALYPAEPFEAAGLGLAFVEPVLPVYDRGPHPFEPGLSVLDALAFAGPSRVAQMIGSVVVVDEVVPQP